MRRDERDKTNFPRKTVYYAQSTNGDIVVPEMESFEEFKAFCRLHIILPYAEPDIDECEWRWSGEFRFFVVRFIVEEKLKDVTLPLLDLSPKP